jgi:hypothetical protein
VRGKRICKRSVNRCKHVVRALQNIVVPKSQDTEAQRLELLRPQRVISRSIEVLTAVDFQNQPLLKAYEVSDVTGDLMLPSEFAA